MDPMAAKFIGAGIACIGMGGAGVGVGVISISNMLSGSEPPNSKYSKITFA